MSERAQRSAPCELIADTRLTGSSRFKCVGEVAVALVEAALRGVSVCAQDDCTHPAKMSKVQKVMTQPVNVIFSLLRSKQRVTVWLYEQPSLRLEGRIAVREWTD